MAEEEISEVFRPDPKLAKTSMDGRVIYEDVDFTFLSGADMKAAGEKLAHVFPSFIIWVTGGPYRGYDARYQVDIKKKIISLDFYSPRPGLHAIPEFIGEIKAYLKKKGVEP